MSTFNYATIKEDPTKLLDWLNNNLLLAGSANGVDSPGITNMEIVESTHLVYDPWCFSDNEDNKMGVYELKTGGKSATKSLQSFVCNYEDNEVKSVNLTEDADFCFTATMSGCTFGVGMDKKGVRKVSHANSQVRDLAPDRKNNQALNSERQVQMIKEAHGIVAKNLHGLSLLDKAAYRINGEQTRATTFGIRVNGDWEFHSQVYKVHGKGKYEFLGVITIKNPEELIAKKSDKLAVPILEIETNINESNDSMPPPEQANLNSIDIRSHVSRPRGNSNRLSSKMKQDIEDERQTIEDLEDQIQDLQLELQHRKRMLAKKESRLRTQRKTSSTQRKSKPNGLRSVSDNNRVIWT